MAYTCACYPSEDATLEEAQWIKIDLVARKLGAAPGDAAARRGLRLGRHGAARRARVRRQGARRHAVRAAGAVGAECHQGAGPFGPGRGAAPGLPGRGGDRLRRGQLDRPDRAHRQGAAARLLRVPLRQARAGGAAAQPLHHPARQHRARPGARRVHLPVRVPRRRARGARLPGLADARRRLRGPPRGEPARALREDAGRLVRQPGRPLGRGGRRGRRGHGPGLAAVHGGSRLGFERNQIQLHQVLGVRLGENGRSGMSLRPDWEPVPAPVS